VVFARLTNGIRGTLVNFFSGAKRSNGGTEFCEKVIFSPQYLSTIFAAVLQSV